jgi:hypothetical protein
LRSRQESSTVVYSDHERTPKVQTATAYLETLNPEQRRAVEHGQREDWRLRPCSSLLERDPEKPTPSPIASPI